MISRILLEDEYISAIYKLIYIDNFYYFFRYDLISIRKYDMYM